MAGVSIPPESLTGGFKHPNFGKFCLYTGDMLFGKKGFVFHIGVGLVGLLMLFRLLGVKSASLPKGMVLMAGIAFLVGVLVYALGSNNQSGLCRSVRWFVPLGIPLWYVSSPLIRESGWKNRVFVLSTSVGLWVAACGSLVWPLEWKCPARLLGNCGGFGKFGDIFALPNPKGMADKNARF